MVISVFVAVLCCIYILLGAIFAAMFIYTINHISEYKKLQEFRIEQEAAKLDIIAAARYRTKEYDGIKDVVMAGELFSYMNAMDKTVSCIMVMVAWPVMLFGKNKHEQ